MFFFLLSVLGLLATVVFIIIAAASGQDRDPDEFPTDEELIGIGSMLWWE